MEGLSPQERQRILEMREAFHDGLRAPKAIMLRHDGIWAMLARGVQDEAVGAEAALRAVRRRNYRRPKPRADGC